MKKDLRKAIREYISENNMTIKKFSELIDYDYDNFIHYLKGRRDLPYEKVEEVLGILWYE